MRDWRDGGFAEDWREAVDREDAVARGRDAERFLSDASFLARMALRHVADAEPKGMVAWLAAYGLERDPEAAVMARGEWRRFLASMPQPIPTEEAFECLIFFYLGLQNLFAKRGVKIDGP